jgi:hypothetical protein
MAGQLTILSLLACFLFGLDAPFGRHLEDIETSFASGVAAEGISEDIL